MIRETYNIPIITNSIVEIEALDTRNFPLHQDIFAQLNCKTPLTAEH